MNARISISILSAIGLCALVPVSSGQAVVATAAAPATAALTQEKLLSDLNRQLVDRFQLRGELQLELVRPLALPAGATSSVEAVIVDFPARIAPSLMLKVRLQSGEGTLGSLSLQVKAQLLRDVWVARTPIERGSSFDSSQLDTLRVDVLQQRETIPADTTETDFTYVTTVSAGRPLVWRDITRRSLIRKGQIVEVSAIDGTLTITTKAMAMENGAAGDTVRLRNLESKKDFTALVVADARAQVRF